MHGIFGGRTIGWMKGAGPGVKRVRGILGVHAEQLEHLCIPFQMIRGNVPIPNPHFGRRGGENQPVGQGVELFFPFTLFGHVSNRTGHTNRTVVRIPNCGTLSMEPAIGTGLCAQSKVPVKGGLVVNVILKGLVHGLPIIRVKELSERGQIGRKLLRSVAQERVEIGRPPHVFS